MIRGTGSLVAEKLKAELVSEILPAAGTQYSALTHWPPSSVSEHDLSLLR